jgi:hypothetical protein
LFSVIEGDSVVVVADGDFTVVVFVGVEVDGFDVDVEVESDCAVADVRYEKGDGGQKQEWLVLGK